MCLTPTLLHAAARGLVLAQATALQAQQATPHCSRRQPRVQAHPASHAWPAAVAHASQQEHLRRLLPKPLAQQQQQAPALAHVHQALLQEQEQAQALRL
jgi:hypothetical protein